MGFSGEERPAERPAEPDFRAFCRAHADPGDGPQNPETVPESTAARHLV